MAPERKPEAPEESNNRYVDGGVRQREPALYQRRGSEAEEEDEPHRSVEFPSRTSSALTHGMSWRSMKVGMETLRVRCRRALRRWSDVLIHSE